MQPNLNATGFDAIPDIFCWTKMGAEAGQPLNAILHRKELERSAGGGIFAWGIGNSLGNSAELAKKLSPSGEVDVLFTPMLSNPKLRDTSPSQMLLWMYCQNASGGLTVLPDHVLVTSRGGSDKRTHYALICRSEHKIEDNGNYGVFDSSGVKNLASLNPVGASQVTSVVRYEGGAVRGKPYRVLFKAKLHADGFVRLVDPVVMNRELILLYEAVCKSRYPEEWRSTVRKLKEAGTRQRGGLGTKPGPDSQDRRE